MKTRAQQFSELKEKHPNAILLFHAGKFYTVYNQDAWECNKILGITVQEDGPKINEKCLYAIAAFPHQALDTYLPRLIRAGKRVAICDNL